MRYLIAFILVTLFGLFFNSQTQPESLAHRKVLDRFYVSSQNFGGNEV